DLLGDIDAGHLAFADERLDLETLRDGGADAAVANFHALASMLSCPPHAGPHPLALAENVVPGGGFPRGGETCGRRGADWLRSLPRNRQALAERRGAVLPGGAAGFSRSRRGGRADSRARARARGDSHR